MGSLSVRQAHGAFGDFDVAREPTLPLNVLCSLSVFVPPGVVGIETEAVMLGLPVSLTLPEVVGCELSGSSNPFVTSIDVVLGITKVIVPVV